LSKRYRELDSLRGIASLTVVFHHCLLTVPIFLAAHYHSQINSTLVKVLAYSPLHIIWAGHEAVILFFVLSGFVLSLPFLNQNSFDYRDYIIKRFCRIYIPYIVSIIISGVLFTLIKDNEPNSFSDWFNMMWSKPITLDTVLDYVLMQGFDSHNLNTVTWSLVHEMRISLFLPLLFIPVIKLDWKRSLTLCIFVTLSLWVILLNLSVLINNEKLSSLIYSISNTFYYSSLFVIGAVFAKYKSFINILYNRTNKTIKSFLIVICLLLYSCEWVFPGLGKLKYSYSLFNISLFNSLTDFLIVISVLILFTFTLNSPSLQKVLGNKYLLFLGKISYSLYLVHILVLLSFIYIAKDTLPIAVLLMCVPFISIITAVLYYKFIELPSIKLANKFTRLTVTNAKKTA
jgi:peptidoglycan/LPS O-acetylase OafA/YrhL